MDNDQSFQEPKFNKNLVRSLILGILVLFTGLVGSKMMSRKKAGPEIRVSSGMRQVPVEAVQLSDVSMKIEISGRLKAVNRLELFSEVNGVLMSQNFRAGQSFGAGQIVLRIDDREYQAQVRAQKALLMALVSQAMADISLDYPEEASAWSHFLSKIDPSSSLPEIPQSKNASFRQFVSARNILSTYYTIKSQEERLAKYEFKAPFAGVLSETSIDPGALVRSGQKLGSFTGNQSFEMEGAVTRSQLKYLKTGNSVKLYSEDGSKSYTGIVRRINEVVNPGTQLISVYLNVQGSGLKEGVYLKAEIDGGVVSNAVLVKRHLCEDGRIFLVGSDSALYSQEVTIAAYRGAQAIIQGIPEGALLPAATITGAFEGLKIIPITTQSQLLKP